VAARDDDGGFPPPAGARVHGGIVPAELDALRIDARDVVDCSVSVNPYGPAPSVAAAVRAAPLATYPDPSATAARVALARLGGTVPARVVLGNGAADLLWTLARVLVGRGTRVLIPQPTFAEFAAATAASGGQLVPCAGARPSTLPEVAAVAAAIAAHSADVVYLCAPNNPTGEALRAADVAALAAGNPRVTFVVDEAFLSLSEHWADADVPLPENAVRVRSLTKEHALAGVRVGYVIACEELAARIERARPAWTTSAMAQAAAVAACDAGELVARSRRVLLGDRDRFVEALRAIGLVPEPTSTFYFLVLVSDAAELRRRLLVRHQVLVRDCASFGLPDHIRIATRRPEENARVCAALAIELEGAGVRGRPTGAS
jgi:histidinol-phosphate/aromatic aminotransferase/cobyric acid decarboxylase-like protein